MNGKSKCKILKEIRQKIAQDNDIAYVTSECKYQGDCTGTCPKCEGELRYLEQELAKRQRAGKAVAVAGVALAVSIGAAGCGWESEPLSGDVPYVEETEQTPDADVVGEIVIEEPLMGDIPLEETEDTESLLGDVAYGE